MTNTKDKLKKIRLELSKVLLNLTEVTAEDGTVIVYEAEVVEVGTALFTYDEAGEQIVLADGEYVVDGQSVIVVEGLVAELPVAEEAPEEAPEEEMAASEEEVKPEEEVTASEEEVKPEEEVAASVEEAPEAVVETVSKEEFNSLVDSVTSLVEKFNTLSEKYSKIEKEPGTKPAKVEIKDSYAKGNDKLSAVKSMVQGNSTK